MTEFDWRDRGGKEPLPRDEKDKMITNKIIEVTEELLEEENIRPPVDEVADVNKGFCNFVCSTVWRELDVDDLRVFYGVVGMGDQHYWLERSGAHFDAESPNGLFDYRELEIWGRLGTPTGAPKVLSPEQIKDIRTV